MSQLIPRCYGSRGRSPALTPTQTLGSARLTPWREEIIFAEMLSVPAADLQLRCGNSEECSERFGDWSELRRASVRHSLRMASLVSGSTQQPQRPTAVSSSSIRPRAVLGAWVLGVWVLASFACASGDTRPDGLGRGGLEWCAATCATVDRCGQTSAPNCQATCEYNARGYLRRIVPEAIAAETECLNGTTECPETIDALFSGCAEQAALAVPLSTGAENFCAWLAEPFFECAWFESPDICAETFSRFAPEALTEGVRCADATCDELSDCLASSLGTYGEQ